MDQDGTTPQDIDLVLYIDATLSAGERRELDARLAAEPELRARLATLAAGGRPFLQAFDGLLPEAPVARLSPRCRGGPEAPRPSTLPTLGRAGGVVPGSPPAAWHFALGALAGAVGVRLVPDRGGRLGTRHWRAIVAENFRSPRRRPSSPAARCGNVRLRSRPGRRATACCSTASA